MKKVKTLFIALFLFTSILSRAGTDAENNSTILKAPCIPPPDPKLSDVTYENHGCGNGVTLTATPSEGAEAKYHYVWEGSQNNVVTVYSSGSVALATVKGTDCYSLPIMVSVTVQEVPPTPIINQVADECGYVDLEYVDAEDGTQYYWQSSNSTFENSNSENPRRVEASGSYYLKAKKGTCWSSTKRIEVTVKQLPEISGTLIPVVNHCGYSSINIPSETSEVSYYWQTNYFGTNDSESRKQDFTVYQEDTQKTYFLRGKHKISGCWNEEDDVISFTANPKTKVVEPIGNVSINSEDCGATVLKLPTAKTNETNYWVADLSGSSPQTGLKTFNSDGTYFIQAKNNSSGCLGLVKSGPVDIKDVPPPAVIPSVPTEGCAGSDPVLLPLAENITANTTTNYYWQETADGTSTSDADGAKEVSESGRYYIRGYDSHVNCWSLARWYDVDIQGAPQPSISEINQVSNGCGNGVTLSITPPSAEDKFSYYWEGFGYTNSITVYSSGTYEIYTQPGPGHYGGCRSASLFINVTVQDFPPVPEIRVLDPNTCGYLDLTFSKADGISYYWQPSNDLNSKQTNDETYPKRIDEDGTYYLRALKGGCWSNSIRSLTVAVPELPEIDHRFANVLNECGQSTMLMPPPFGETTYYWQNSGLETNDSPDRTNDIVVDQDDAQKTFFIRTKHNVSGCWNQEELTFSKTASPLEVPGQPTGNVSVITDEIGLKVLAPPNSSSNETYYWQVDEDGFESTDTGDKEFTSDDTYILRARNNNSLCWSTNTLSGSVQVLTEYPLVISNNYVWEYNVKKEGITQEQDFATIPSNFISENVNYFDGIGRSLQSVRKQFSQSKKDVVTPIAYDEFGNSIKSYLDYSADLMLSNEDDGSFKSNSITDQKAFYDAHFGSDIGDYAFSETEFESSPLNRPVKAYAPGQSWAKKGDSRAVTFEYGSNVENEVIRFKLNNAGMPVKSGYYKAGSLSKIINIDENDSEVVEYKDLKGRVILKNVGGPNNTWLMTYYIYDNYGNLSVVLPPEASKYFNN